jgi:hypothetical protein
MSTTQQRQPKGTENGGQFAASVNPESTVDLTNVEVDGVVVASFRRIDASRNSESLDASSTEVVNRTVVERKTIDGHSYRMARTDLGNGVVRYSLHSPKEGGGWNFDYDQLTRRAEVRGVRPRKPTPSWRDRGEADIRNVMKELEPNAELIKLDGETYRVDGPLWPLSKSELSGISTGEMMMTGGKSEDDLREYVAQQRSDVDRSESERPDMAASFAETRLYVNGISIAADLGHEAAEANTVGAMRERGL